MRTNKILMLGILALGLVGCAMEGLEGVAVTARQEGDTVRISTTIARVDSRLAYEEGTGNTTFTAIVAPNVRYIANDNFMTFDIGEDTFYVLAKPDVLTDGLQPGKHYTFNLTVGQDKVTIEQVSMNDIGYPFGEGWNNDFETDLN